jgi:hypothetical protein
MSKKNDNENFASLLIGIALVLVTVCVFWFGKSYFESRSYNRLTGGSSTTWDALFVQLRVQGVEGGHE